MRPGRDEAQIALSPNVPMTHAAKIGTEPGTVSSAVSFRGSSSGRYQRTSTEE